MAPERARQVGLLAALLVALAAVVTYQVWQRPASVGAPSSNARGGGRTASRSTGGATQEAPDVHLSDLQEARAKPNAARNLFRFKPKAAPAPAPAPFVAPPPPPPPPAPGSTVPPITLKFLGTVEEQGGQRRKIAVLSDGRSGAPIYGKEGDVVLGQYKILRIGAESIEIAYLDGSGRRTIRQSGS
jgi:hypothetical protein